MPKHSIISFLISTALNDTYCSGLEFKHKERIGAQTAYWGGFGIYATRFFCHNKLWLDYVEYLNISDERRIFFNIVQLFGFLRRTLQSQVGRTKRIPICFESVFGFQGLILDEKHNYSNVPRSRPYGNMLWSRRALAKIYY